jgi:hypothetical protein
MLVNVILQNGPAHWQKISLQLAQTNLLQLPEKILDVDQIFTCLAQAFALRIHRVSQVLQAWVSPGTPISASRTSTSLKFSICCLFTCCSHD